LGAKKGRRILGGANPEASTIGDTPRVAQVFYRQEGSGRHLAFTLRGRGVYGEVVERGLWGAFPVWWGKKKRM